jgi:molybdopterin converting factor small subunit
MDLVLKQILDEIKTMKASVDELAPLKTAVEELKASMATRIDSVQKNLDDRFSAMENAVEVFDEWKPKVDAGMEDLGLRSGIYERW